MDYPARSPKEAAVALRNRAGESRSPYVRGHANNPVAWQLWNDETLELAKRCNRLLFVSVGYAACHWCHVMERESFESQEVADVLNASFIPVKVDREERPDIDAIYMNYVQATTGGGGWPMNVWLTPDLEPIFGGTYFPGPGSTTVSGDAVGLVEILGKMRDVWRTQEEKCRTSAKDITRQLKDFAEEGVHGSTDAGGGRPGDVDLEIDLLEEAYRSFAHQYDALHGGFSSPPKFPTPAKLRFLLNLGRWSPAVTAIVGDDECAHAASMALTTLRKMARGGIRDQIGTGFARYSVTRDWSLPHFEKMNYDQSQLLDAYLDAFLLTHDAEMLGVVYDVAEYLTSPPVCRAGGGFYSSEDADSAPSYAAADAGKHEGAYYVWTTKTLERVLGPRAADIAARFYGAKPYGNISCAHDPHDEFHNQNVLYISGTTSTLAKDLGIPEAEIAASLRLSRKKLREYRERERPRPALDDKVIVAWNGLSIGALARASSAVRETDAARARQWRDAAKRSAEFIESELWDAEAGTLWRVWREGRGDVRGLADDYAGLISGLLELYAATWEQKWLRWADELMQTQLRDFAASAGGFYTAPNRDASTSASGNDLLLRLKSGMDNAEPSANALSAANLFRLGSLLGDEAYTEAARATVAAFEVEMEQWPASFPGLLAGVVYAKEGCTGIMLVGGRGGEGVEDAKEVRAALEAHAGPRRTALRVREEDAWIRARNGLLRGMKVGGEGERVRIMICEGGVCREA